MIEFFQRECGYTSSGLTIAEKKELEDLRVQIKNYRQIDAQLNNAQIVKEEEKENASDSDDNEDQDIMPEEELIQKVKTIEKKPPGGRCSVSAEAYGDFNKKKEFKPRVIPKTPEQINRIKTRILTSFIFSNVEKNELDVIISAMEEKRFQPLDIVITQGENGDCLYVVEEGELDCYKSFGESAKELKKNSSDKNFSNSSEDMEGVKKNINEGKLLKTYTSGDSFGELALLYNTPRAASIISKTESILWSLDRETFNNVIKEAAQKKREKYEGFLKNVEILKSIDSYELMQICDSLSLGVFQKGDYIIREGEMGDVFYLLEEGECKATKTVEQGKPAVEIKRYSVGDYFGERALIKGDPRYANIIAEKDGTKVLTLDRKSFKRLLGPIEDILKRNIDNYKDYCLTDSKKITEEKEVKEEKDYITPCEKSDNKGISTRNTQPETNPSKSKSMGGTLPMFDEILVDDGKKLEYPYYPVYPKPETLSSISEENVLTQTAKQPIPTIPTPISPISPASDKNLNPTSSPSLPIETPLSQEKKEEPIKVEEKPEEPVKIEEKKEEIKEEKHIEEPIKEEEKKEEIHEEPIKSEEKEEEKKEKLVSLEEMLQDSMKEEEKQEEDKPQVKSSIPPVPAKIEPVKLSTPPKNSPKDSSIPPVPAPVIPVLLSKKEEKEEEKSSIPPVPAPVIPVLVSKKEEEKSSIPPVPVPLLPILLSKKEEKEEEKSSIPPVPAPVIPVLLSKKEEKEEEKSSIPPVPAPVIPVLVSKKEEEKSSIPPVPVPLLPILLSKKEEKEEEKSSIPPVPAPVIPVLLSKKEEKEEEKSSIPPVPAPVIPVLVSKKEEKEEEKSSIPPVPAPVIPVLVSKKEEKEEEKSSIPPVPAPALPVLLNKKEEKKEEEKSTIPPVPMAIPPALKIKSTEEGEGNN